MEVRRIPGARHQRTVPTRWLPGTTGRRDRHRSAAADYDAFPSSPVPRAPAIDAAEARGTHPVLKTSRVPAEHKRLVARIIVASAVVLVPVLAILLFLTNA